MIFKTKQDKHQIVAHKLLQNRIHDNFGLFCKMRTGKTKMILDDASEKFENNLTDLLVVICPNGVQFNWSLREIPKHVGIPYKVVALHSKMKKKEKQDFNRVVDKICDDHLTIVCINLEAIRLKKRSAKKRNFLFLEWLIAEHKTILAIDESHRIKTPETQSQQTNGCMVLGRGATFRRIATGTPEPAGPLDLYSQFKFLDEHILDYGTMGAFKADFCVTRNIPNPHKDMQLAQGRYAPDTISIVVGFKNEEKLKRLIKPHHFAITLEECEGLGDISTVVSDTIYVMYTPDQERLYKELINQALASIENPPEGMSEDELIEWLLFSDVARVTAKGALSKTIRTLQLGGGHLKDEDGKMHDIKSNRLSAMLDFIEPLPSDEKFIIWCTFTAEIEKIQAILIAKYGDESTVNYYGATTKDDRNIAVDRLNNDPTCRFFVANANAAGRGLDLAGSRHMIWYTLPNHNFEIYTQACSRQLGINQKRKVIVTHFSTPGKIEDKIINSLDQKRATEERTIWNKD